MANILYIDTVGPTCSAWLCKDNIIIASESDSQEYQHAAVVTNIIRGVLAKSNLGINQVDAVCCCSGPGSYTALRVGQSVAKAICLTTQIPFMAFSVFDLVYQKYKTNGAYLLVLVKARADECYYQLFGEEKKLEGPGSVLLDSREFEYLISRYTPQIYCSHTFQEGYRMSFEKFIINEEDVLQVALNTYFNKNFQDIYTYSPLYIKAPHITQPKRK